MKKILALLVCCMLMIPAALSESAVEESAPLSYEELQIYLSALPAAALEEGAVNLVKDEDGRTVADTGLGQLTLKGETLDQEAVVLQADLSVHQACPRGLFMGDTLEMLLNTYPNDNAGLVGSYYDAALYITGEKPEIICGYLLRDGQRVTQVTHVIYHWQEDGQVIRCGVEYSLDQGTIVAIRVFGMEDVISEATALEEISDCAEIQEISEYSAYPQSEIGNKLTPFEREDLAFAGLDLLDMTYEDALRVLGDSPVDDWTKDSTGDYLRLRQWDGISLLFNYDAQKNFKSLNTVIINGDNIEGPRGVRPGDAMETVIYRFLHGQGGTVESGILLYGDGENPPYGVVAYSVETATITYTQVVDEKTFIWQMTFNNATGLMESMRFLVRSF